MTNDEEFRDAGRRALEEKLATARVEHRDLDAIIMRFEGDAERDELMLRRLKKKKLLLKDQISWMERQLEPDEPA